MTSKEVIKDRCALLKNYYVRLHKEYNPFTPYEKSLVYTSALLTKPPEDGTTLKLLMDGFLKIAEVYVNDNRDMLDEEQLDTLCNIIICLDVDQYCLGKDMREMPLFMARAIVKYANMGYFDTTNKLWPAVGEYARDMKSLAARIIHGVSLLKHIDEENNKVHVLKPNHII
jgi:hypothetical protein